MRINGRNRTRVDGAWAPDRNDEYLLYQTLVGVWPAEAAAAPIPSRAEPGLVDRVVEYMQKAVREAKVHTSWIHEQPEYGRAVARFVERALAGGTAPRFLASFVPFQRQIAQIGMLNSLAQLVLKLASPGVPDFYQGSELWDTSLVDPDNRRPVDFTMRQAMLEGLRPLFERLDGSEDARSKLDELLAHWFDGRIKLLITRCGLQFRREHRELVLTGDYEPLLGFEGPGSNHLVAFARRDRSGTLLAVVPRLSMSLTRDPLPRGSKTWGDTQILLPGRATATRFRHVLTGETVSSVDGRLRAAEVFHTMPVALLWADASRG
jgi:(1->4)-alpha-D-glucan 1-alpha-D-glucosylmutase